MVLTALLMIMPCRLRESIEGARRGNGSQSHIWGIFHKSTCSMGFGGGGVNKWVDRVIFHVKVNVICSSCYD